MERKNKIILIGIIVLTVLVLIVCGYLLSVKNNVLKDSDRFRIEYMELNDKTNNDSYPVVNISENNTIKYITSNEAVNLISQGTGVIYFGFNSCFQCRLLVETLLNKASQLNETIYYLNIENIRSEFAISDDELINTKKGSQEYYKILDLLDEYLDEYYLTDNNFNDYDTFEKRLQAPTLLAIKNGEVTDIHVGTVEEENISDGLKNEQLKELEKIIENLIISKN